MGEILDILAPSTLTFLLGDVVNDVEVAPSKAMALSGTAFQVTCHCRKGVRQLYAKVRDATSPEPAKFQNEVRFYRELAPELRLGIPVCHQASFNPRTRAGILLLEFVAGRHPEDGLTEAGSVSFAQTLGALHTQTIDPTDWPSPVELGPSLALELPAFLARLPEALPRPSTTFVDRVVGRLPAAAARMAEPVCMVHYDLHPHNILVSPDQQIVVLDWQTVGAAHPAVDVMLGATVLASDVSIHAWFERYHQLNALDGYHERLRDASTVILALTAQAIGKFLARHPTQRPLLEAHWVRTLRATQALPLR